MTSDSALSRRIAALEARIGELESEIARLRSRMDSDDAGAQEVVVGSHPATDPLQSVADPAEQTRAAAMDRPAQPPLMGPSADRSRQSKSPVKERLDDPLRSLRSALRTEDIVSKVGIGLLLIGLALMFKFGVDRGWITPPVRVAIGFLLGCTLTFGGLRIQSDRRRFSRVLIGGGLATFYVTIFSAYQLYSLVSYEVAFVLMVAVTGLAFALALRQDDVVLSLIATVGGLGTPFILFAGSPGILWLIVYTCLVSGSAIGVYVYRGWRWLLVVVAAGGWAVLAHVWLEIKDIGYLPVADKVVYQVGVLFCLGLFGIVPVVREMLAARDADRWPVPKAAFRVALLIDRPGLWLSVASPLIALLLSRGVWDVPPVAWGALEVVFATMYWAAYLFRRTEDDDPAVSGFGVAAGLLLAVSWFDIFESSSLTLLALTLEAGAILLVTRVDEDRPVRMLGHLLFAFAGSWTALRLSDVPSQPSLFRIEALVHLSVVAGFAGCGEILRSDRFKSAYRLAAIFLLALAWSSFFASGSVRILAIAAQAAVLMLLVRRLDDQWLRYAAHFLFIILGFALLQRVTTMPARVPPLLNGASLADLVVIGIAAASSFAVRDRQVRLAYQYAAYVAFLVWFWRDLVPLEDGHAFVSIAWGVTAVALITAGWRTDKDLVRQTGLVTLAVVVLKLFLIDLAEIDAVWRIVLFVGFGALLLVVSYLFPSIWRGDIEAEEPHDTIPPMT